MLTYDRGDLHPRLVVVLLLRSNVLPQEGVRLDVERARFLRREGADVLMKGPLTSDSRTGAPGVGYL